MTDKKQGRPPRTGERMRASLNVPVTDQTKRRVARAASRAGKITMAEWVRRLIDAKLGEE